MKRPTVRLIERQSRNVALPRTDVSFLLTHARHLVEVVPTFRRHVYRITARGVVGWFDGPSRRFVIGPKVSWPTLQLLLGFHPFQQGGTATVEMETELLTLFAEEFLHRLEEVKRIGLIPGYQEQDNVATFVRGKLRTAELLREAAVRAFPDRFPVSESVLDLDTPWNRFVRSTAELFFMQPQLPITVRNQLQAAIRPLNGVQSYTQFSEATEAWKTDPRLAHYQSLFKLCQLIHVGVHAASLADSSPAAFLIDLGQAFEQYLARELVRVFPGCSEWSIEVQPRLTLGVGELQPDIVIRKAGQAIGVFDAKWKHRRPEATDLHQVLAYGSVTGAQHVGLIYPGQRLVKRTVALPHSNSRLSIIQVPVLGPSTSDWLARFSRWLRRYELTESPSRTNSRSE